jgi:hypothetical protein
MRQLNKILQSKKQAEQMKEKQRIDQVIKVVTGRLPWAEEWITDIEGNNSKMSKLDAANYSEFMELLYSSFYTTSVQGRPSAIQTLTFKAGVELLKNGVVLSSEFKTQQKYGYQPVIARNITAKLLKVYLKTVRPKILGLNAVNHDKLWINFNGSPVSSLSHKIIKFFKNHGHFHLTSNDIRSVIETAAKTLEDNGVITGEQRRAVQNVNGHTSKTTSDHYIRQDRTKDAKLSNKVFKHISAAQSTGQDDEDQSDEVDDDETREEFDEREILSLNLVDQEEQAECWGSEHIHFKAKGRQRATWMDLEVQTIGDWCAERIQHCPALRSQIVKHCWKNFTTVSKSKVMHIFHPIHIRDNARLSQGLTKAQEWAMNGKCKDYLVLLTPEMQLKALEKHYFE